MASLFSKPKRNYAAEEMSKRALADDKKLEETIKKRQEAMSRAKRGRSLLIAQTEAGVVGQAGKAEKLGGAGASV